MRHIVLEKRGDFDRRILYICKADMNLVEKFAFFYTIGTVMVYILLHIPQTNRPILIKYRFYDTRPKIMYYTKSYILNLSENYHYHNLINGHAWPIVKWYHHMHISEIVLFWIM